MRARLAARAPVAAGAGLPAVWVGWGIGLLALLLCVGLGLTIRQRADTVMVLHGIEVDDRLAAVLSSLQDAEVGSRGYELTGRREFLAPYRHSLAHLQPDLDALARATADNPRQSAETARLRLLATDRMAAIAAAIVLHGPKSDASEPFVSALLRGKAIMDATRGEIVGMRAEQTNLLIQRQARSNATFLWTWVVSVLGLGLVAGVTFVGARDNDRRIALVGERKDELDGAHAAVLTGELRSEAAESQVRQLHKMEAVGQLTGGIAHDFNNMLAIVIASLDLARRQILTDPDRALARIDNALEGAHRASTLTARLLAFSRQQALAPVALDPNGLVAGMSDLLHRSIGERVRIEVVLNSGVWRIRADAAQLENTVLNLCVNARDAMVDGGRLTIETSNACLDDRYALLNEDVAPGDYVLIAVTDSGEGMSRDTVLRAFEPFYTTKAVGKGTGLGLSQVFGFMKQSGGHAKIYSEPGVGTTVKIYFPRWLGVDQPAPSPRSVLPPPIPASGEIVLVVEDDPDVRLISIDALRYLGYVVLHASSAEEALAVMAASARIDLLFTDIVMPGANGPALASRALMDRPDLKVLYTTGYARDAVFHNRVLEAGVAILPKPFTVDQLAAKVREVLHGATSTS